jgi:hypothetical protein
MSLTRRDLLTFAGLSPLLSSRGYFHKANTSQKFRQLPDRRSNLNLNFLEICREHRYINCAKSSQRIINPTRPDFYLDIDANHYPTKSTNGISFTVYVPGATTYVVKWRGSGSLSAVSWGKAINAPKRSWNGGGANGSLVTNGRITFTVPSNHLASSITIKGPTMRDLVICRLDEEEAFDAGQIFRKAFINQIRNFNPACLRFMDSQATNTSILNSWEDRPPPDLVTYQGTLYGAKRKVGFISGMNDYVAPAYGGMPNAYAHGEIIHGHLGNASNSTTVTLDVGGRGAKSVVNEYLSDPAAAGSNMATRLLTTVPYTFMYDAYFDKWIFNPQGASVGHPIEMLVSLCNAAGVPGWFNIPFYATDEFVAAWTKVIVDHYEPDEIFVEYGNEIWNFGYGFPMTARAAKWGDITFPGIGGSGGGNFSGWYGYRMRQIATIIRREFGANRQVKKVQIVLASQGAAGDDTSTLANVVENKRFQNVRFAELSGVNAPIAHADVVAFAQYYGGKNIGWLDKTWGTFSDLSGLKAVVDDYLSGDASMISRAFRWIENDFIGSGSPFEVYASNSSGRWVNWNALARAYGKTVALYEFNHEVDAPSPAWTATHSPFNDPSYGGQGGKIKLFLLAWLASDSYQRVVETFIKQFYSRSQSSQCSVFGMCTPDPWLTFAKLNPTRDTSLGGDSTQPPYANWRAHMRWNSGALR